MEIFIYLGIGAIAGTSAGLLGVGGGIIVVPALIFLFEHQGMDQAVIMHVALGTSLATIVVTSLSSIRAHQQRGAILWPVFRLIAPGIVVGAFAGAFIAKQIAGDMLKIIFGIFLIIVAIQMMVGATPKPHRQLPGRSGMFMGGSLIGSLASMMGVGGGTMSVPFLTWCNVTIHQAVATSSAIGLPIALAGVSGFIITGLNVEDRPDFSFGYVSLPAFVVIAFASLLFAPLGAKIAHSITARRLKLVFGVFLLLVSAEILY